MALDPRRPGARVSEAERVYLCRRLRRLDALIARLEQRAAVSTGWESEAVRARLAKHRDRADRIRAHLRAMES